jgi:hypothetical protein
MKTRLMLFGLAVAINVCLVRSSLGTDFNIDATIVNICHPPYNGVGFGFVGLGNPQPTATYFSLTPGPGNLTFGTSSSCWPAGFDLPDVQGFSGDNESWIENCGRQLFAGDLVHVGFSSTQPNVTGNGVWPLELQNPNQSPSIYQPDFSCGEPTPEIFIHTKDKSLTLENPCTNAIPTNLRQPLYLSGGAVEYYTKHQPLKTLNSSTVRHPLKIDKVNFPTTPLQPCDSTTVPYDPPQKAHFIVLVFSIDTDSCTNRPSRSRAWAEFPLDK